MVLRLKISKTPKLYLRWILDNMYLNILYLLYSLSFILDSASVEFIEPTIVFKEDGKALIGGKGVLRCMFSG